MYSKVHKYMPFSESLVPTRVVKFNTLSMISLLNIKNRLKTLSLKVPNVEFDVSVSVDKMQLLTNILKIQNVYLS